MVCLWGFVVDDAFQKYILIFSLEERKLVYSMWKMVYEFSLIGHGQELPHSPFQSYICINLSLVVFLINYKLYVSLVVKLALQP
jgi:hypothetical protein